MVTPPSPHGQDKVAGLFVSPVGTDDVGEWLPTKPRRERDWPNPRRHGSPLRFHRQIRFLRLSSNDFSDYYIYYPTSLKFSSIYRVNGIVDRINRRIDGTRFSLRCSSLLLARETVPSKMSLCETRVSPTQRRFAARRSRGRSTKWTRWNYPRGNNATTRLLPPSLECLANKSSTFLADVTRNVSLSDSSEKQPGRRERFDGTEFPPRWRGGKTPRRFMARTDGNSLHWRRRLSVVSRRMRLSPGLLTAFLFLAREFSASRCSSERRERA